MNTIAKKTYYYKKYESARKKYLEMQKKGYSVVLRRPIHGIKTYRVRVL